MDSQVVHRSSCALGFFLFCCLALAHVLPLAGESIDEARAAYTGGRFTDAALAGENLGTSQGFALASKSLTIHAYFIAGDSEKEALFRRAVGLARKAVSSDSGNADADLQLVRAIGRLAQMVGSFEAGNRGYAEEIRAETDNALRLDPGLVSAHLSPGRWHAGVVGAAAGSFLARARSTAPGKRMPLPPSNGPSNLHPMGKPFTWNTRSGCWRWMKTNTARRHAASWSAPSTYRRKTPTSTCFTRVRWSASKLWTRPVADNRASLPNATILAPVQAFGSRRSSENVIRLNGGFEPEGAGKP